MFATQDTTIICIDLQEKLVNMLNNSDFIAQNAIKLMKAANILDIDTIITEQYPKGLGETINSINSIAKFKKVEKTTFSAMQTQEFNFELKKNIVIFGIETHICVLQTAIDLLKRRRNVYIVSNCCSSRDEYNHNCALNLINQFGGKIITLEIALFEFLKSSKHPNFKEIQALIK